MENKENLNLCAELCKQKDIIQNLCSISSKILEVLRGAIPSENAECVGENCMLDTMLDGARTKIIASNTGMAVEGNILEVVKITGILIHQLKKSGVSEKLLKDTFNSALGIENLSEEKAKKNSNDKKELREFLKGLNEALAKDLKDLEEMLGDEEDE